MTAYATGGTVSFAPLGSSLDDASAWTPIGHTVDGSALSGWSEPSRGSWDFSEMTAGRTVSFSFTGKKRNFRRLVRFLNRPTPASIRRAAMRGEYHRRSKRR